MILCALAVGGYFTPKFLTQRKKVVLHVLCLHRPVVFGIGLYPRGVIFLTNLLKARTLYSSNPYIPLRILR